MLTGVASRLSARAGRRPAAPRWAARRFGGPILPILVATLAGWAACARSGESDASKTEAELRSVKAEIERITREVSAEQVERDRISRELKSAETSVGASRAALEDLRRQRLELLGRRTELSTQKRAREADVGANREQLAGQLRAAYLLGRGEPLRLLLSESDPTRLARLFVYYSYFGRARAGQIQLIEDDLHAIESLDQQLASEEQRLTELETARASQLKFLEHARAQRSQVLAKLDSETHSREQSLARLKVQQAGLEKLLAELRRSLSKYPVDATDAFAHWKGKLAWPVSGRIMAHFGESRAGAIKWDGVLLATERGAPVRAVYAGRVVYADWLPGLGLLAIIDHGSGYMSLYGHNERLFKSVGERVTAGEPIGAAGDSGGSNRPELYFEIRKAGKPVDPRPWFGGEP